jgi:ubiquinone/menaquinone biosynthesis C-methylase UbiE
MSNGLEKWPKIFPELTAEQQWISDDFMAYWHTVLPKKYKLIEKFNHNYVVKNATVNFRKTLEIGVGLGEHIFYEKLSSKQRANYFAFDLRQNMVDQLKKNHPDITTWVGDCQEKISVGDHAFDRIIAIHVLEHLPNLPAAVKEIYRVCDKKESIFSVVIPCEGGLAYSLSRKISAQRIFEKRYKQPYKWFIEREHVNKPAEILKEILPYFRLESRQFFPFKFLPFVWCNLCIGLTFKPRTQLEVNII